MPPWPEPRLTETTLTTPPDSAARVRFAPDFAPRFLVTVDTEEEFDWSRPLAREGHGVTAVAALARFQGFCEAHGVAPCYMVDHPVVAAAADVLGAAVRAGRADVGVQLHPWVSPPFEEAVSPANSYPGNLPEPLERAKLTMLTGEIAARFGVAPRIYRAGRYGVGPATARLLAEAGIAIDSSVRARFDYRVGGGPDFSALDARPWRVGAVMELPLTTVFTGRLRQHGAALFPRLWPERMRGVFARSGLLERIPLTPEGTTIAEGLRAIDAALADEVPVLVFSMHSPSLAPGHTPYVRDTAGVEALYAWWAAAFAHLARRGVRPGNVGEILAAAG